MMLVTFACEPATASAILPYTFVDATMFTPLVGTDDGAHDTSVTVASAKTSASAIFFTVKACLGAEVACTMHSAECEVRSQW